jgi:hypothetical protein
MAVISILMAKTAPIKPPTTMPAIINSKLSFPTKSVTTMAINIPIAPIIFPRTAVRGCARPLSPRMKRVAAIKYAILTNAIGMS